jgi:hypothetical protein
MDKFVVHPLEGLIESLVDGQAKDVLDKLAGDTKV